MICPNCGSNQTYIISDSKTTGSDVNICNGVLGYVCLGPLGILCAFFGGNKRTITQNYVVCNNCHIRSKI